MTDNTEQEPVAKYMGHRLTPEGTKEFWGYADKPLPERTNLYAAPVRTKNLTDEEIDELWLTHGQGQMMYIHEKFARAVITKFKEKNK